MRGARVSLRQDAQPCLYLIPGGFRVIIYARRAGLIPRVLKGSVYPGAKSDLLSLKEKVDLQVLSETQGWCKQRLLTRS